MRACLPFALLALLACKYGASDEDPKMGFDEDQPLPSAELIDASALQPETPSTSAHADAGKDARTSSPVGMRADAGSASASACEPKKAILSCDPVRNTGCPPLTQCDIETSASEPTGRCVFNSGASEASCSSSFVNISCDAQQTCVAGQCRKLCYCDGDCPQGQSCSDSSGPGPAGAFKLCR